MRISYLHRFKRVGLYLYSNLHNYRVSARSLLYKQTQAENIKCGYWWKHKARVGMEHLELSSVDVGISTQSEQQRNKPSIMQDNNNNITTNDDSSSNNNNNTTSTTSQRHSVLEKSLVLVPGQENKEEKEKQSLRDRIFSRFSGSTFMKQALYAKDRIAERVDESDNPIVLFVRNIYDRLFGETEMGQVIREIRQVDPQFTLSEFVRQIERETAPRILNAYLRGDRETLRELCTEDAYRALSASIREREAAGLVMDPNILDISQVEVMTGKFLQGFPVMIVTFAAQQINCIRNLSNKVIEGSEDDIRAVHYIWAMVRDVDLSREEKDSTLSEQERCCWKLMEMVVRTSYSTI